jgi:competence protein ComEC
MKVWKYFLTALFLLTVSLFLTLFSSLDNSFKIIACDVGQGDAILVTYQKVQILTDGGPDNSVLTCLNKYIPFWDREIELVVLTHPQLDHYGGLIEVLKRFKVNTFITSDFQASTQGLEALKNALGGSGARVVTPDTDTKIRLGMIYLDILHPSQDTSIVAVNDLSIVSILTFKNFEAILTGDIGKRGIDEMLEKRALRDVDYIKIPHHGSRNGLTPDLLEATTPEVAIISVGKDNSYGHPHEDVLKMLTEFGVKYFRTDEEGDIVVTSDGESWRLK